MDGSIRAHVRANVVAYLALFVALGGSAVAAKNEITGRDVAKNTLTGKHIREKTLKGVTDSCPGATVRFGTLCVGSDGVDRTFFASAAFCERFGLRLPTLGEARMLAQNYDIPGVGGGDIFWTDEISYSGEPETAKVIAWRDQNSQEIIELRSAFGNESPEDAVCVIPASDAR